MSSRSQKIKVTLKRYLSPLLLPLLILLFLAVYLSQKIVYNIMSGESGVKWRRFKGGTQTEYVYPEGIHFIYPWDKLYIYNIRIQQTAHDFNVLTENGMNLRLYISIRYYPETDLLGLLHQKVGPNYVETVVIPEIESVLRVLIGRMQAEEVYTTKQEIIEKAINYAVEQIAQRYINVDDVIIKRIDFPAFIKDAIEKKMEQQQLAKAYEFRIEREEQEKERKRIEAEGFERYNKILASSLSEQLLLWRGIQATLELAQSPNAKIIVIGSGERGLPIIGNIPFDSFENLSSVETPETEAPALLGPETPGTTAIMEPEMIPEITMPESSGIEMDESGLEPNESGLEMDESGLEPNE